MSKDKRSVSSYFGVLTLTIVLGIYSIYLLLHTVVTTTSRFMPNEQLNAMREETCELERDFFGFVTEIEYEDEVQVRVRVENDDQMLSESTTDEMYWSFTNIINLDSTNEHMFYIGEFVIIDAIKTSDDSLPTSDEWSLIKVCYSSDEEYDFNSVERRKYFWE